MRRIVFLLLVLLIPWLSLQADGERKRARFTNVSRQSGIEFRHVSGPETDKKYLFEVKGGGVAFLDYDNDGWPDVVVVQGSTVEQLRRGGSPKCELFRNKRDGTFERVTEAAGLKASGWGMGVAAADYDNDGWVDLYITSFGPNTLYRNNGDGTFTDVTEKAGVGDPRWSSSAAFGDYDLDGDLDLYVVNYVSMDLDQLPEPICRYRGTPTICGPRDLPGASDSFYRNNGDGTFTEVSRESGASDPDKRYGLGAVWGDVDNDGDPDLYVANDFGPNFLFINQGDGTFEEFGLVSGTALSGDGLEQAGMGIDIADYDNDGLMDIFVTHFAHDYSTLYRNTGDLMFEDVTGRVGIQAWEWFVVSWGTHLADVDHDGWKDIFHANGHVYPFLEQAGLDEEYRQAPSLFLNRGDGTFQDASSDIGPESQRKMVGRGTAMADYDNDGDLDFLIANLSGSPQLLRNDLAPGTNWVMFRLKGTKSNRDGIGARVKIRAGGVEQVHEVRRNVGIYSSSDARVHFGTGKASQIELVEIFWPGEQIQRFEGVAANRHYLIDQEAGLGPEPIAGKK
jgi:enediyne biosynthesis protein E4